MTPNSAHIRIPAGLRRRDLSLTAMLTLGMTVTGCASTNYSTSPTPASVRVEWHEDSLYRWYGAYIYKIGDIEWGWSMPRRESRMARTVDPGPTTLRVFLVESRGYQGGLFAMTEFVDFPAVLQPNAHYQLHCEHGETTAHFQLLDSGSGLVVASSEEVPVVMKYGPWPKGNVTFFVGR